jgi:hypothetical protein
MAMAYPKAAVQKIADEIKEKANEAGLDKADKFMGILTEMKEQAANGPGDIMDKVKAAIEAFKQKMQDAMDDPSSLAPASVAACAAWYGNAVVGKLKDIMAEVEKLFKQLVQVINDMTGPLTDLGKTVDDAVGGIKGTVEGMMKLPTMLGDIAGNVSGPGDVANIDTASMKKNLDTGGISAPLDAISKLKDSMVPVADGMSGGIESLTTFIQEAPSQIKGCFEVPSPMCCLTSCVMSQAPEAMTTMLDQIDQLSKFDLQPVVDMLKQLVERLSCIDVNTVKEPINKFAEMAGEKVDNLEKVVESAKLAGSMGDMAKMGKDGKMPKMGCLGKFG